MGNKSSTTNSLERRGTGSGKTKAKTLKPPPRPQPPVPGSYNDSESADEPRASPEISFIHGERTLLTPYLHIIICFHFPPSIAGVINHWPHLDVSA